MVKRPLLFLLIAYILGGFFYEISTAFIFLCGVILLLVIYVVWKQVSKNKQDFILILIPFIFFLGHFLMGLQQQPGPFDTILAEKEIMVSCTGQISKIQATQNSNRITLVDVIYEGEDSLSNSSPNQVKSDSIIIYSSEQSNLHIGNKIEVYGKLSMFTKPTNLGQFDEQLYYKIQNIDYKIMAKSIEIINSKVNMIGDCMYQLRTRLSKVYEQVASEDTKGSLQAMLLGEKGAQEEEIKALFQVGGISHILAISGLHITLLGMAIFELLHRFFGVKSGVIGTILFVMLYGVLTNFSVSTNRAVVMMILLLAARWIGRTYDLISALCLSALIILIRQPMQIYQSGFLMSYGAVIGVACVYPYIQTIVAFGESNKIRAYLGESILFFLSIQITTLPILLLNYYQIPVYAVILNLLVLPCMSALVILGLVGGVLGCFWLPLGMFVVSGAVYLLKGIYWLCNMVYQLPGFYFVTGKPTLYRIGIYVILMILGICFLATRTTSETHRAQGFSFPLYKMGILWMVLAVLFLVIPIKDTELKITMLDIGQGDCLWMKSPQGTTYLIDGGSSDVNEVGKYRIAPFVKASGYQKIDYVLLSHADSDHISGVLELVETILKKEISIGTVVLPYTTFEDKNYVKLESVLKENGVPIWYIEAGDQIRDGELTLTCLHPAYHYAAGSANDYSMVLSLHYGKFSMLFTGDMEAGAEDRVLKEEELQHYDVLKVAHHGSKYSTSTEWLDAVQPTIALISAGKNNSYKHPHKEVLERLEEKAVKVYTTIECGAIELSTDGEQFGVSTFLE